MAALVLEADDRLGAMLLERCQPGCSLRSQPEHKQDQVIAGLTKRLRAAPAPLIGHPFRHLCEMVVFWKQETLACRQRWADEGLVEEGLRLMRELAKPAPTDTLFATDLHAGNVLRADREPWLMIDPKPFHRRSRLPRGAQFRKVRNR